MMNEATRDTILVRPLHEHDLGAADYIRRLAFGTFLSLPDPTTFGGDAGCIRTRWLANPSAAFGAEVNGVLVGSNFATNWGSIGFFGPLTVHPDFWGQGVAKRLIEPVIELFAGWGIRHAGLFTYPHSPKHVGLYEKFGFNPRFLTAIMSKLVQPTAKGSHWSRYSELPERERVDCLNVCRELTDAVYDGLDVKIEICAVCDQKLGDTVLLWDDGKLVGLAVCHWGAGTEAGSGRYYVKFGAVRPGPHAGLSFDRLLEACEVLAAAQGMSHLVAGVNTARLAAYRQVLARGFRTDQLGLVMQKPNEPAYNRADVYLIDDWR